MSSTREEKRKTWEYAINMNQIDGPWEPGDDFMELIEREINGEITTEEMRQILIKKHTQKYLEK